MWPFGKNRHEKLVLKYLEDSHAQSLNDRIESLESRVKALQGVAVGYHKRLLNLELPQPRTEYEIHVDRAVPGGDSTAEITGKWNPDGSFNILKSEKIPPADPESMIADVAKKVKGGENG